MIEDKRETDKNFAINVIRKALNDLNEFKRSPEFRLKFKQGYMKDNFGPNGFYSKIKTIGKPKNE